MGEDNALEERINKVSGAAGQVKVSQGPGLPPIWMDLPAGGATYTELNGSVNTTANALGLGDGAWGGWDLTATLPVGTVAASITINKLVATDNVGVRMDGSGLARSVAALKLEVVCITVKVLASRIIEIMSGDVSDLDTFSVIGYWV